MYIFGLFATDIFVNAGQLITGSLAPHFLSVCQPNYTALGCQDLAHFVSQSDACTGDPDDIMRARKTFPSKEAALSLFSAVYLAVSGSVYCAQTSRNDEKLSSQTENHLFFRCTSCLVSGPGEVVSLVPS